LMKKLQWLLEKLVDLSPDTEIQRPERIRFQPHSKMKFGPLGESHPVRIRYQEDDLGHAKE